MKANKKNPHNEKPITLAPLTEDDMVRLMLETPPMPKRKRRKKSKKSKK